MNASSRHILYKAVFILFLPAIPWIPLASETSGSEIRIFVSPDENKIIPDTTPVTIRIETLKNSVQVPSDIKIKLILPPSDPFFSTEFPVIEGTGISMTETKTENGTLVFTAIFPIRGMYTLDVKAVIAENNKTEKLNKISHIKINENPDDVYNFTFFSAILLFLGIFTGYIFQKNYRIKQQL